MARYKILFLDHTPFVGGAQLALVRHLNCLDYSKFEAIVACVDPDVIRQRLWAEKRDSVKIIETSFGRLKAFSLFSPINFLRSVWLLIGIVSKERPNIVVANTERTFYAAIPSILIFRPAFIVFVRDFEFSRLLMNLFDAVVSSFVCVSKEIKSYYFGSAKSKAVVIYVGTDVGDILSRMSEEAPIELKRKFDLEETFVIGFVGRLVDWKGALILPEIAKLLAKNEDLPAWKFVVVGGGSRQEGNIEPQLREKIRHWGLERYFSLVGFSENTAIWYKVFTVLLHTSKRPEPFATVVVEALSASLPVIATNMGGTKEVIVDGQNGVLVDYLPQEFARVILSLMMDSNLYRSLREGAFLSSQNYLEEDITREIESVYFGSMGDA